MTKITDEQKWAVKQFLEAIYVDGGVLIVDTEPVEREENMDEIIQQRVEPEETG